MRLGHRVLPESVVSLSNISMFQQVLGAGRVDGPQRLHIAQNEKCPTLGCSNNHDIIITITPFNIWD